MHMHMHMHMHIQVRLLTSELSIAKDRVALAEAEKASQQASQQASQHASQHASQGGSKGGSQGGRSTSNDDGLPDVTSGLLINHGGASGGAVDKSSLEFD